MDAKIDNFYKKQENKKKEFRTEPFLKLLIR